MKKVISVLLAALMLFGCTIPVAAQNYVELSGDVPMPIVMISGDADPIFDAEGNKLLDLSNLSNLDNTVDADDSKENLMSSIANVLYPFLVEGLLTDNWDNYYANLQKEIGEILGDAVLDNNGEVTNGSHIGDWRKETMDFNRTHDKIENGQYNYTAYKFWYDWRRDPIEIADDFNAYIQDVKRVTNSDKISLIGKCLGTSVVMAYVAKYGLDDIYGICLDGGISNGSEAIGEIISGKFVLDGNAINRFLIDCNAFGLDIDELIISSVDLLEKAQVLDSITTATKETIYYRVIKGVTSALALSTAFTWPSYWSGVSSEDFETAKEYVFGPEGSEKRTEYAGLIEKIDNYDVLVRQRTTELMKQISDNGNIGIISKYGMQMFPCVESRNELGDQFVSVEKSSYGATTSTIYGTLSDKYIAGVVESGNGRYISPDKQIDASTCLYPDNTWFVKGASHTNWTEVENYLMATVATYGRQLTVDDFRVTQFIVFDGETKTASAMTEDNMNCYNWSASESIDNPTNILGKVFVFIRSLFYWLQNIITRLKAKEAV